MIPSTQIHTTAKKKVLILGAALENEPFIRYLLESGFQLVCVDKKPAPLDKTLAQFHDALKIYAQDFSDDDTLDAIIAKEKVDYTLALPIGRALVCLGRINDKFAYAGPSFYAIDTLTDKQKFHLFCEEHGLNHCHHLQLAIDSDTSLTQELKHIEESFTYPFIIKPTFGSGSSGVEIISSRKDLLEYQMPARFDSGLVLIEELIQGTEYSCSFVVDNEGMPHCMGIFSKYISKPPYRQESVYFSDDFSDELSLIFPSITTICNELKLKSCFISSDVIVTKDKKPFIIDISPRLGGNSICTLLSNNNNHPLRFFQECIIDGQKPVINKQRCAVLAFFDFDKESTYMGVTDALTGKKNTDDDGIAACFNNDEKAHIIELINDLHVGDEIGPMKNGADVYRGHIVIEHDSIAHAYQLADKYLAALQ